jgi:hypothetical protein
MPEEATQPNERFADRVPSKEQPIIPYDDGYGTRSSSGTIQDATAISQTRRWSIATKTPRTNFQTQRVSINERHFAALAEGFAKAAEMVKARTQAQGQAR